MSSRDSPTGGSVGLKTQAHSEQPQTLKFFSPTRTNLRDDPSFSIQPSQADAKIVLQTMELSEVLLCGPPNRFSWIGYVFEVELGVVFGYLDLKAWVLARSVVVVSRELVGQANRGRHCSSACHSDGERPVSQPR
jgi:hypothetical protein